MKTEKDIVFTKHALKRAKQRKLWSYVNKKIVYYDATLLEPNKVLAGSCVYVLLETPFKTVVKTMYLYEQ